jgi:selenocysteine lyase/cysteine desulfurase
VHALRAAEFPWAARGAGGVPEQREHRPLPERAAAAQREWIVRRTEPFRLADGELFATVRRVRELAAALIGAGADEVACMPNTSYGLNLAASALPLGPGDVVVAPDREFPANVYPWMALAARGVRLELVPSAADGLPDEPALLRALERPEVRALTVSWVQFGNGHAADLAALGAACRARGKFFVVDAIQGLGARPLDVRACHVDVLACGAQKWLLAPWGTGFLYVRRALVERLVPGYVGWLAVQGSDDYARLTRYDFTLWPDARRFEVRTLPFQDIAGYVASLELFLALGPARVAAHVAALAGRIVRWAAARDDVRLATPVDAARRAGIVSVVPRDAAAAAARLREAGVTHSVREGGGPALAARLQYGRRGGPRPRGPSPARRAGRAPSLHHAPRFAHAVFVASRPLRPAPGRRRLPARRRRLPRAQRRQPLAIRRLERRGGGHATRGAARRDEHGHDDGAHRRAGRGHPARCHRRARRREQGRRAAEAGQREVVSAGRAHSAPAGRVHRQRAAPGYPGAARRAWRA